MTNISRKVSGIVLKLPDALKDRVNKKMEHVPKRGGLKTNFLKYGGG